jgi:hypothetical protein
MNFCMKLDTMLSWADADWAADEAHQARTHGQPRFAQHVDTKSGIKCHHQHTASCRLPV